MKSRFAVAAVVGLVAVAAPSSAPAADTYVNGATGSDTNDCLQPTAGAPGVGPCLTIAAAVPKAGAADEILIADGTYNESVTIGAGKVLSSSDGDIDPKPVINGVMTISVTGGSLDHLSLTGGDPLLQITGPASVTANELSVTTGNGVLVQTAAPGTVTISGNEIDGDGAGFDNGIFTASTSANVAVEGNEIQDSSVGIFVQNGVAPAIRDNAISGVHSNGSGILVYSGFPEITANTIASPADVTAVGIQMSPTPGAVGGVLARNQIVGPFGYGLLLIDVTSFGMDSDLIAGSLNAGLLAADTAGPGDGNVNITNLTAYDSIIDIKLQDVHMSMNSSILETTITDTGTATCAITFSRGPLTGAGCDGFQTTADPMFVDPGAPAYDYHLPPGSPMIDAGDPAAPATATDIDGDPRAILGLAGCTPRRDLGADEFGPMPALQPTCPALPSPAAPASAGQRRKCKKGRKLIRRKGKLRCVKKKKKK